MAMTKRMRVSFSLGTVLSTEDVENFKKTLCELSLGNFRVEFER